MALIILDPSLEDGHGHHSEWDLAIASATQGREQEVVIVAHRNCTFTGGPGIEIVPWFSHTCYEERSRDRISGAFDDFRHFNDALAEELALLPRERFQATDAVLVPTLTERHLLGYVAWMKSFEPLQAPLFVIHLMFPSGLGAPDDGGRLTVADPFQALFYQLAFRRAAEPGPTVHFFGGGRQLAREFSELVGKPVQPHPIPTCPKRRKETARRSRPAALLFAGDAKADKGFLLIPGLADRLAAQFPDWDFLIHANANAAWGPALQAYETLLGVARERPNLRLVTGRLPRQDYLALMEDADCYLCTYDPAVYARKSSGVVWEAISLGLPVLVPAGTWLENEPREWGAGHASYAAWTVDDMVEGFARFVPDLPGMKRLSAAAAERYHSLNGAEALVSQIGQLWAPRMLAASMTSQPSALSLPVDTLGGAGWFFPEQVDGAPVRWAAKEFDIDFAWPHRTPWQVEIRALRCIGEEQVTKAQAFVSGEPVSLRGVPTADGGGRLVVTGKGPGRDQPQVRLRISLPWTFRPEGEARDLGLLISAVDVAPAQEEARPDEAGGRRAEVLTEVRWCEDGRAFHLEGAASGTVILDPREAACLNFDLLTADPGLARGVRLYVNGVPVAPEIAAAGRGRWRAVARCSPSLLARRGYRAEWDLVLDAQARGASVLVAGLRAGPHGAAATQDVARRDAGAPAGDALALQARPDAGPGAGFDNVELNHRFVGSPTYAHLDISLLGLRWGEESWARVRFKFCVYQAQHYFEFRLAGWPHVLSFGPAPETDQHGALLRLGDGLGIVPPGGTAREEALVRALVHLLPQAVEATGAGAGDAFGGTLAAWVTRARSASAAWSARLVQEGAEAAPQTA